MNDGMCQSHILAIVIPAYKANYLSEALDSIALQTDKRFCVYIGDDNSSEDIESIVSKYDGRFNYIYKRFEENLGGKDLVAQWERCIDMTRNEPWIWLFSDDDIMDSECVSAFYRKLDSITTETDLLRFDVKILNRNVLTDYSSLPEVISSEYLFKGKMNGKMPCFAVEYIFSRNVYNRCDRFQNFDLAWHSDIATWMKFGKKGIHTIKGPKIIWRNSGENITGSVDKKMEQRKWNATVSFFCWLRHTFFKDSFKWKSYTDFIFIKVLYGNSYTMPMSLCLNNAKAFLGCTFRKIMLISFLYLYKALYFLKLTFISDRN